jgi:glyoxylase-like metal-dependent hydrolase (beta-lactamase superfamily II)
MTDISTLRILEPAPGVIAYYDGRIAGRRAYSEEPNWLDDGGFSLGIASYAIVDEGDALVYDTHLSIAHARAIRHDLQRRGIRRMRVVLSHSHLDHIAGNAVFADCEIVALMQTAEAMAQSRAGIEDGSYHGLPAIDPLVMPTTVIEGGVPLEVGRRTVLLEPYDIHSRDGLALLLPEERVLLAGDTLEDTLTYVAEPERLETHLRDLARMGRADIARILPNHGDPGLIAAGGYGPGLIGATERYVGKLLAASQDHALQATGVKEWLAADLAAGHITWFEPYAGVHRENLRAVRKAAGARSAT